MVVVHSEGNAMTNLSAADWAVIFAALSLAGTVAWCVLTMINDQPPIQRDEPQRRGTPTDQDERARRAGL